MLYNFSGGADGATPEYIVMNSAGDIYGAASEGGNTACNGGCGTIFKLSKSSGHWVETTLYTFTNGNDGAFPTGITLDAAGNIYGFAQGYVQGGNGPGTAFRLSHPAGGGWRFSLLHKFAASSGDGIAPVGAPLFDAAGNLYGSTQQGGGSTACTTGCGTFFELTPTASGPWSETIVHSFIGPSDGAFPTGNMVFDAAGNIYGNTAQGGAPNGDCGFGCGAVFELSPSAGGWTETILHSFSGYPTDAQGPVGGVAIDAAGNLYGTGYSGGSITNSGCYGSCGAAWEVSPVAGGGWTEKVIHSFNYKTDGALPSVGVVVDSTGHVFGLTGDDPNTLFGTAYELTSNSAGQWKFTLLYTLGTTTGDGANPAGGSPILDSAGNLYGTTRFFGTKGYGNIFKLTPAAIAK